MAQRVKVQIVTGETLRFPQVCVHCARQASERIDLRLRRGRFTRKIDVPLCAACKREVQRLSGEEERWQRLGWLFGGLVLLFVWVVVVLLLPGWLPFIWRLLLALAPAAAAALGVRAWCRQNGLKRARPEKQAILQAARLCDFSWRTVTFEFENDSFAERFVTLNEMRLMKV